MFETAKLINGISYITNEIGADHQHFNNCLIGFKREEFVIAEVNKIIDEHGLREKTRKQELVHKRFFISHFLNRKLKLSLSEIGSMFNQKHSSIIHSIKKHDLYSETKDFKYISDTLDIRKHFESKALEKFIDDKMDSEVFNDTDKFKESQLKLISSLSKKIEQLKLLYTE